uniref:PITH domain-containing protein n=1 Tax=Odontella aurita TaxID=265563 RepID=A0A7S4JQQ1_9STRA|mmetsp:Transcript_51922/g.155846  ORF Transcript_51922/g.155846 Transcript_51922/m.155846 type:complete len:251 (+) Transcript_51922:331-1083(+)
MTGNHAHGHSHDHDHEDQLSVSLQSYINKSQVFCLNEHRENAGRSVLKPYVDRFTLEPNLRSPSDDDDLELLMHIPFTEAVAIKSICINGRASIFKPNGEEDDTGATSAPFTCKVFANRTDLDFDMARELDADATIELLPPEHSLEVEPDAGDTDQGGATLDFPLRPVGKFRMASSVTLFFGDNFAMKMAEAEGDDDADVIPTEVTYIGFKGTGTSLKRVAVECVYETRGMKKDHKTPGAEFGAKESTGF